MADRPTTLPGKLAHDFITRVLRWPHPTMRRAIFTVWQDHYFQIWIYLEYYRQGCGTDSAGIYDRFMEYLAGDPYFEEHRTDLHKRPQKIVDEFMRWFEEYNGDPPHRAHIPDSDPATPPPARPATPAAALVGQARLRRDVRRPPGRGGPALPLLAVAEPQGARDGPRVLKRAEVRGLRGLCRVLVRWQPRRL